MQIPFVDLRTQYASLKEDVDAAIADVLSSGTFVGGKVVSDFENEFAAYCETKFSLGVANGTDALELALEALGIGVGDEVITSAHSFIATAAAIARAGATPVFVDIDPHTYTIDPALIEDAITNRTKAIIPVHLYGQPADMEMIMGIARRRGLFVIEDAAQAHGAEYEGQRIGSFGDAACFSFYPGKNLGAYGDGGAITTSNGALNARLSSLRDHGRSAKYDHKLIGTNSRLDTLQAAVLQIKLHHLDAWNRQRQSVAASYCAKLAGTRLLTPSVRSGSTHVFHLFVVQSEDRDALMVELEHAGISSGLHYPVPLHMQPAFAYLKYSKGDMPVAETLARRGLSVPMFPEITREQVERVSTTLIRACAKTDELDTQLAPTSLQGREQWQ